MRLGVPGYALLVLALSLAATVPAAAEFFNCNQRPGQVLYSYSGSPGYYGSRSNSNNYSSSRRYSGGYTAPAPRRSYQAHASYSGTRHYWNDRSRW